MVVYSEQKENEETEIFKIWIPVWVPVSILAITMGLFLFFFLQLSG
jgi:hypothetical protein